MGRITGILPESMGKGQSIRVTGICCASKEVLEGLFCPAEPGWPLLKLAGELLRVEAPPQEARMIPSRQNISQKIRLCAGREVNMCSSFQTLVTR
jgi:hypothetical protein